jgi:hypothetical protein
MKWTPRTDVIARLTEDLCWAFVACKTKSKYKKLWVLEAILAGSGVGKSRLGIETIEAILRELEENPRKYQSNVHTFTKAKKTGILEWGYNSVSTEIKQAVEVENYFQNIKNKVENELQEMEEEVNAKAVELLENLVATLKEAQWVFLDSSNGDKIPREWIEAASDDQLDDLVAGYLAIKILSPTSTFLKAYPAVHGKTADELLQIIANSVSIKFAPLMQL